MKASLCLSRQKILLFLKRNNLKDKLGHSKNIYLTRHCKIYNSKEIYFPNLTDLGSFKAM